MNDYLKEIAFDEGYKAYGEMVFCLDIYNPYEGVSETLKCSWREGWWKAFYEFTPQLP